MSASSRPAWLRELIHRPFFWGIVAIVALLALNVIKDPGYLAISVKSRSGEVLDNKNPSVFAYDRWERMDAVCFAEAVRRSGGGHGFVRYGEDLSRVRYAVGHLEVFLPPGAGRITSPRQH